MKNRKSQVVAKPAAETVAPVKKTVVKKAAAAKPKAKAE